MDIQDSYVVRVFRRRSAHGETDTHVRLIGVVESPGTGHSQVFHDIEELWTVLAKAGIPDGARPANTGPDKK